MEEKEIIFDGEIEHYYCDCCNKKFSKNDIIIYYYFNEKTNLSHKKCYDISVKPNLYRSK